MENCGKTAISFLSNKPVMFLILIMLNFLSFQNVQNQIAFAKGNAYIECVNFEFSNNLGLGCCLASPFLVKFRWKLFLAENVNFKSNDVCANYAEIVSYVFRRKILSEKKGIGRTEIERKECGINICECRSNW